MVRLCEPLPAGLINICTGIIVLGRNRASNVRRPVRGILSGLFSRFGMGAALSGCMRMQIKKVVKHAAQREQVGSEIHTFSAIHEIPV